ncbi:MAG: BrnT family toxin [Dehalococcoidia bacterium]
MSIVELVEFEWDDDHIEHLVHHGITPDEVEELFDRRVVRRRGDTDAPNCFRVLGRTTVGRYLTIVYEQRAPRLLRPFTGWDMGLREREIYDRQVKS